ncbi:MAG: 4Fe-4S binding protein [Candidatus Alcyoniella australis]|nr:4Fe-4S binding protein [Candidatus Alcyoniella australis]
MKRTIVVLLIAIALCSPLAAIAQEPQQIDTSMTIRQVIGALKAQHPGLAITGQALAHELELAVDVDKNTPLDELGVNQQQLEAQVAHLLGHEESGAQYLKYPLYVLLVMIAMAYLLKLGIPRNADPKQRRSYYPQWVYVAVLIFSVLVLGFALGKSPNPMEGAVKVFKSSVGLYESFWVKFGLASFFLALAIVANKAVCGWACPFGSLQELIYMLPLARKIKRRRMPFWLTNGLRVLLFVVFLLLLYGVIGRKGYVIYHKLNPFNLFNLDFSDMLIIGFAALYLVLSLFFYRPFCRLICPFGLISWVVERLSLTRVRIDFERCIDCRACEKACPLSAAKDRLDKRLLPADCFSCMRCLRVCPVDAIHYRPVWGPPSLPVESVHAVTAADSVDP